MLTTILSFGVPALLSHFGVSLALPSLAGLVGARAASAVGAKVVGKVATASVSRLLQHIGNGGDLQPEHREWVKASHPELFTVPKLQPGQQSGPDVWTISKQ